MTLEEWLGPRPMAAVGAPVMSAPTPLAHPPLPLPAGLHSDRRADLLAQDARVAQLFATGGISAALPAFRDTPLGGLTTLLDLARRDSGFDPTAVMTEDPRVETYFRKLFDCPLLDPTIPMGEWTSSTLPLPAALADDLLTRFQAGTRQAVGERIRRMFADAGDGGLDVDPFYYSAISERAAHLVAEIVLIRIFSSLAADVAGFMPFAKARFMTVRFRHELWPAAADKVAARHYQSATDWLASN